MKIEYTYLENVVVRVTSTLTIPDGVVAEGLKAVREYTDAHDPTSTDNEIVEWNGRIRGTFKILTELEPTVLAARRAMAALEAASRDYDLEDMDKGVKLAWDAAKEAKQRYAKQHMPNHIEMIVLAMESINQLHEASPDNTGIAMLGASMLKAALACVPE